MDIWIKDLGPVISIHGKLLSRPVFVALESCSNLCLLLFDNVASSARRWCFAKLPVFALAQPWHLHNFNLAGTDGLDVTIDSDAVMRRQPRLNGLGDRQRPGGCRPPVRR